MTNRWLGLSCGSLFLVLLLLPTQGRAGIPYYTFDNITGETIIDGQDVAPQFSVFVTQEAANQVLFTFWNKGNISSSITDIYFDDGSLLGISDVRNGPGVSFARLAIPSELPGSMDVTPHFVTTAGFSADSDPPIVHDGVQNGVHPEEWVGILFDLKDGKTYTDVLSDLALGAPLGLRIGLHVQGIGPDSGSDSFVNDPGMNIYAVPLPASILLGVFAVGLAGRKLRQFV